jgi:hypothetical protein
MVTVAPDQKSVIYTALVNSDPRAPNGTPKRLTSDEKKFEPIPSFR